VRYLSRLTYANVMATLAFFLAVSGATAIGASGLLTGRDIRNGSLTGRDVKNHSLTTADLGLNSVLGGDVKDGSLRAADLDPADLELLRGPQGAPGAQGVPGPQGPAGPAGDPGSSGIQRASWTSPDVAGYVSDTPLLDHQVPANGGWLMLAVLHVTNTSASDDWFSCGVYVDGQQIGGGGGDTVTAGTTRQIGAVGFGPVQTSQHITVKCQSGGSGSFDLTALSLSVAKLM
jgi:hypothetical protein